eukprot:3502646-Rhodomonas_salina.2
MPAIPHPSPPASAQLPSLHRARTALQMDASCYKRAHIMIPRALQYRTSPVELSRRQCRTPW